MRRLAQLRHASRRVAHRALNPPSSRWSLSAEQQVLRRLDKSFKAFFGRIKRGENSFSRFRAKARYHAAEMRVGNGLTIRKSGRLGFVGVSGEIKVRWHRTLPRKPASAILTRQHGKWYVVFHVEVAAAAAHANTNTIGIDLGLTALVALSNGETVATGLDEADGEGLAAALARAR